jgi:hypothetical protein
MNSPTAIRAPSQIEIYGSFRRHLGPRFESAGIGLVFLSDENFGVDCIAECSDPLVVPAIRRGIEERVSELFSNLRHRFRVEVVKIDYHNVDSSARAFYLAARAAIDQAFIIINTTYDAAK